MLLPEAEVILLVDGMYLAFSSFYTHTNMKTLKGEPTGAIYGFISRVESLLKELQPTYIITAFDTKEKTFRHEMYPAYKAKRQAPPEDLITQLPFIKEYLSIRGIQTLEKPGIEADDIIAHIAKDRSAKGNKAVIFTADKDLFQLVGGNVFIYHPKLKTTLDREGIKEHFGIYPELIVDYLSLVGDASDNIPGVPGIGDKTAKKLIEKFGRLDDILTGMGRSEERFKKKIESNMDSLKLSRELVDLAKVPEFDLDYTAERFSDQVNNQLLDFYKRFAFTSLLKNLEGAAPASSDKIDVEYHFVENCDQLETLRDKIIDK